MQRLEPNWRKSSYSADGNNCVEVGTIPWRKSTHSGNGGPNCVELGAHSGEVLIRDTKTNGTGPVLRVAPAAWRRFTTTLKR